MVASQGNMIVKWYNSLCLTHLFRYSEVSSFLQQKQVKQNRCQCLSRAMRDWQLLMDSLQPAHSREGGGRERREGRVWGGGREGGIQV